MSDEKALVSTATKTTAVGGGAGVLISYGAMLAAQKWNLPLEVAAVIVGGAFSFISRWAGKLVPRKRGEPKRP